MPSCIARVQVATNALASAVIPKSSAPGLGFPSRSRCRVSASRIALGAREELSVALSNAAASGEC
eukprot:12884626-Prorocentrum_lima.AAC.1